MGTRFNHQVGGHSSSILTSPLSSSTLIKALCPTEHAFYTSLGPSLFPDNDFMGVWTPAFYGTLKLQGAAEETGILTSVQDIGQETVPVAEMLVLENLTHRFLHPNVIDIKLGIQLYDEITASEEKIERMKKAARDTTSGESGVRLTGYQTWDAETGSYNVVDKAYGKSLKTSQLLDGITGFFIPLLGISLTSRLNDKELLSSLSIIEGLHSRATSNSEQSNPGIAIKVGNLSKILGLLITRVDSLHSILSTAELRVRGGSLLMVIEGDEGTLKESLDRYETLASQKILGTSGLKNDSCMADSDDDSSSSVSTTDSQGNAAPHTFLPFDVRLIDFAHAKSVGKGEGCDEGLLKGLATVRELLDRLRRELLSR